MTRPEAIAYIDAKDALLELVTFRSGLPENSPAFIDITTSLDACFDDFVNDFVGALQIVHEERTATEDDDFPNEDPAHPNDDQVWEER